MRLSRITLVAAAFVVALAGAALAGVVAHASSTQTTIRVTEKEYSIHLSTKAPPAGSTKLVVKNTGKFRHQLAIKGPGVSKRTPMIKPGKSAVLVVTLKSGTYGLWCPVPGHAALGMKAALKVAGATTSSGTGGGGYGTGTSTGAGDTTTDSGVPWG
jgi:uncharacterized cupredoxin-like copper-binding protein